MLGSHAPWCLQILRHPWYTSGLPAGVVEMNATCLGLQHEADGWKVQTDAEIRAVVAAAKIPSLRHRPPQAADTEDNQVPCGPHPQPTALLPTSCHAVCPRSTRQMALTAGLYEQVDDEEGSLLGSDDEDIPDP